MSTAEGRYGLYRQGSDVLSSMREEEFQEDDVWGVFKEPNNSNSKFGRFNDSSGFTIRRMPTAARMIPRSNSTIVHEPKIVQHSAPVKIPDWSKIYGSPKGPSGNALWVNDEDYGGGGGGGGGGGSNGGTGGSWDSDGEEDDDGTMLPPHEWIARRLARRQVSSFSMCEGAGRTLKGRDLSKVRNAVLTKTGFLE